MTPPSPSPLPSSARADGSPDALVGAVRRRLTDSATAPTAVAVLDALRADPARAPLGGQALLRLGERVRDEIAGAGPLGALLADPAVTDVVVNGCGQVRVDRGEGWVATGVSFPDADSVRRLAQRLAATCERRLDDASPCVDARLPDGTRLHAVLPPVAVRGPYLSLRTFRQRAFTMTELVAAGTLDADASALLEAVVRARLAYVVSGGTGSGKTTLLATLLGLVPPDERIVVVEDATELSPAHPHVVALQARLSNVEGVGAVTLRDLVRQALRMRPDRLVVGECRGAEVVDLLGALNTGHDGGAGTLHANTAADVPARLEALGLLGGLTREALHAQLAAGLQAVVHLSRGGGPRRLEEICVLVPAGRARLVRAVAAWRRDTGPGPAATALARLLALRGVAPPECLGGWT
jgi:pilus assembly protein CpaF